MTQYRLKPTRGKEPHPAEYVTKELVDGWSRLSFHVIYRYNGKLFKCLKSTWERDYQKVEDSK